MHSPPRLAALDSSPLPTLHLGVYFCPRCATEPLALHMVGRTLEHYRIDAQLGAGGMGVVYRAHDMRLRRDVAIKVLAPERVGDAVAKQRFIQEATAASALNHPGIVTIHDIRSDAGVDFIVMEHVAGRTLDALIPRTGLPADRVLRLAVQMADALSVAHAAGIVHRDLKPSNVMVTPDGRVKILDFGLAKLLERDGRAGDDTTMAPVTGAQTLLGTAAYMSPEQAEGRALDGRADIFSFGVMLYEMLTGVRPFAGDSPVGLLANVIRADPKPPSAHTPSIAPDLEKAILRCLRKDPARRYQSMADLKVALEDVLLEVAPTAARRAAGIGAWRWAAFAFLLLAIVSGGLFWSIRSPAVSPQPLRADVLTTFRGEELYPALSPDGNYVAFTWTGPKQDNTDIYVQQIGAGTPLRVTSDPLSDFNPAWSPDGKWIAFLRGNPARPLGRSVREVRLVPPLGGPERKLTDLRVQEIAMHPVYLTWCADSTCLIATDSPGDGKPDGLFAISIESGDKRALTVPVPPALADLNPAVSPDGKSLLFIRHTTWAFGELHVLPLGAGTTAAGEARRVATNDLKLDHASWMPGGGEILVSTPVLAGTAALWKVPASGGDPIKLPYVGDDGMMPAVSRAERGRPARLVYVRSFIDDNIWSVHVPQTGAAASAEPEVAIASTRSDIHPQFSPDGTRVAFTSTRSGPWEIWISDPDGGNATQLTSLRAATGTGVPHWSPDGRLIVFASDTEGQFEIFVVPAAGGKPRNVSSHPAFDHVPIFSHDGEWIYFSSVRSGQFQIWKVAAAGGEPVQVTTDGGFFSQPSRDGRYLYFTKSADVGAAFPVFRMPISGGSPVKVLDNALNGAFAVLDAGIYFVSLSPQTSIHFFDFATGETRTIASNLGPGADQGGFGVSADGRTILFVRRDAAVDDLMVVENFR